MSLLVGICGGSGSGKSTLADELVDRWQQRRGPGTAAVLSFDLYYRDQSHRPLTDRAGVNYDHPDSLDADLLSDHLDQLRQGLGIAAPGYDFASYRRTDDVHLVEPTELVAVEGILLFAFDQLRPLLDFRVFRDCPEQVRFDRRRRRDTVQRGRTRASVDAQLKATVKPMHDRYVQPHLSDADYVTEHGQDLGLATDRLIDHLVTLTPAKADEPTAGRADADRSPVAQTSRPAMRAAASAASN